MGSLIAMPSIRYPSIAPDLDAVELTLMRSIENIRKTLPPNRPQSEDLSAIAFSLDHQELGRASTISPPGAEKALVKHGLVVSAENFGSVRDVQYENGPSRAHGGRAAILERRSASTDSSWKKHIRESEALALEHQMECIRQDMRDLADARQRRDQARSDYRDPTKRKLRRVSKALPQKRASYSAPRSNPEQPREGLSNEIFNYPTVSYYKPRTPSGGGPETDSVGGGSTINSSRSSKNYFSSNAVQPSLYTAARLPPARKTSKGSQPVPPNDPEICSQPFYHHLSKPTTRLRSFSVPIAPAPVPVTSSFEIDQPSQPKQVDSVQAAQGGSADAEDSHQSRLSSVISRTGGKPQNLGKKKVRFAGKLISIEKNVPAGVYGRKSILTPSSPSSSLSSLSSLSSSSQSISTIVSDSLEEPGTSESELHSATSSEDEELGATTTALAPFRTPLRLLSPTRKGRPLETSPAPKRLRKRSVVTKEVKEKDQNTPSKPAPKKGKIKKLKPKYSFEDIPEEIFEPKHHSEKSPGLAGDGSKSPIAISSASRSLPQHTNPHQSSLNKSTSSFRALLRKHSENILNKFSWRGSKDAGLPQTPRESTCAGCREVFDIHSLIQVSAKCLHFYCKTCLKGTLYTLEDGIHIPSSRLTSTDYS